jgi:two-component system, sensor histidine kinase and response regulator
MSLVLVADDEPAVLEVLTEVVQDLGHDVLRAHDGREALALAREQHPSLVVTDHMMPRLSGLELCRALRNEDSLRGIPVILLSAALPPEAKEASAYLAKPFELDEFESLVKRTLDGAGAHATSAAPQPRATEAHPHLLNWVAQEIQRPLAAARLHLEELGDRPRVSLVSAQLEDMSQLVEAMLDASRLESGNLALELSKVDLREVVSRVVGDWRRQHADVALELEAPESSVEVLADERRVSQVLATLISNAVRVGAPTMRVRVELELGSRDAELRVRDFGSRLTAVADPDPKDAPPPASSVSSAGLGLFIASGLVRLHGGNFSARPTTSGRGPTFTVTLPRAR